MTASPSLGTGSLIFGWSDHGALTAVICETVDAGMPVVRLTGRGRAAVERLADPLPCPAVWAGGRP